MHLNTHIRHSQEREWNSSYEEEEILKRIAAGEKDLYALIIRHYNQRLYRIALAITNNETYVPDIMQTAYIKAYSNLHQFRFESGFSTWLTKILVNESLAYLKKTSQITQVDQSKLSNGTTDQETPLMKLLNNELKNELESSIRELPDKYRTVFIMREMECMSVAETMDCLGLSESNVKIRLNRAKVMLRTKLGKYLRDEEVLKLYKPICNRVVSNVMDKISEKVLSP